MVTSYIRENKTYTLIGFLTNKKSNHEAIQFINHLTRRNVPLHRKRGAKKVQDIFKKMHAVSRTGECGFIASYDIQLPQAVKCLKACWT